MSYLIRKTSDIKEKEIICGLIKELTTKEDFGNANISYVQITGETKKHYHTKMTEFYYVLAGRIKMELDDNREECEKGSLIVIYPNTRHKAKKLSERADVLVVCSPAFDQADEFVVE